KLARLGIKAIVFEDAPPGPATRVLVIGANEIKIEDAPELKGAYVSQTFKKLRERYGAKAGLICIGPAGEMLMYGAGVATTDDSGVQVRYAARGGLGAVMGSKGIKAVVVDDRGATPEKPYDPELLRSVILNVSRDLAADPKSKNRKLYGTLDILEMANHVGLMPTRNFSAGSFELAGQLTAERASRIIAERGGEGRSGTPCVPGCTIQCSNVFPDRDGRRLTASIQYESVVLLGPNCGIGDLDEICELNELCNEVGVDTIETGAAIGVAMEAGIIEFGDFEGAKNIIRQIGQGTLLGRVIGNGAALTGRVLGVRRVPAVKGQAIPAYDPRALKGNGVTYLTSPMGADHTAGNCFETIKTNNPIGLEGQVENSWRRQIRACILDTLGLCLFIRPAFVKNPGYLPLLLKGRYGWDLTFGEIKRRAVETIKL
ncbi:MAG: aldehyde ferredoxin oxidoreductase C-terminal domain-containing protein, partial [Desulfotomaculales bacterium]